jgi:hypothetical protein
MSLRVMRMKAKNKTLMAEANARKLFSLAVTNGNESGCKSNPVYNVDISGGNIISTSGPTNMCGEYSYVEKAPSHQQSYGLYLKRATMGIGAGGGGIGSQPSGGLARRVVDFPPNSGGTKGTFQKMLTFKRPQKFTTLNYIENKKSKAIRCAVMDKCDGSAPAPETDKICYNNCSNKPCITEDLGYDDASDQINRRVAMRAGPSLTANYESEMMRNNGQSGCN